MNTYAKVIALLLCCAMLIGLAACTNSDDPTELPDKPTESTAAPTDNTAAPTEPENTFDYQNDALGLALKLEGDWTIAGMDKLGELSGIVAEQITDEALKKQLENSGVVYDFFAQNTNNDSLNIVKENLNLLYSLTLDEDGYIDLSLGKLKQALEGMGAVELMMEKTAVAIAGQQHAGLELSYIYNGVQLYQRIVAIIDSGVAYCVTATSTTEDRTDAILAGFSAATEE